MPVIAKKDIIQYTRTSQQKQAVDEYFTRVHEGGSEPSIDGFVNFYSYWCYDNGYFNDLSQSSFPPPDYWEDESGEKYMPD